MELLGHSIKVTIKPQDLYFSSKFNFCLA